MIKSMTGFGRGEYNDGKRSILVEIRSVNHRYADISVKMPRRYAFAEEKVRQAVREKIKRGKVDVSVIVDNLSEADAHIRLNTELARQYLDNLESLRATFGLQEPVTLGMLAGMPDVLRAVPDVEDEAELTACILKPTGEAATALEAMRAVEGEKLAADLLARGETIKGLVAAIADRAEDVPRLYRDRLQERIRELLDGRADVPEERILTEAAIFADKCNIDEELTRLRSHMDQMRTIIETSREPDGKKLDFLVQEMNREANTIGSKANDLQITELMLQIKAEIEKIREQVQNIE